MAAPLRPDRVTGSTNALCASVNRPSAARVNEAEEAPTIATRRCMGFYEVDSENLLDATVTVEKLLNRPKWCLVEFLGTSQ